jgi:glucose/arabinose dehydrogenase
MTSRGFVLVIVVAAVAVGCGPAAGDLGPDRPGGRVALIRVASLTEPVAMAVRAHDPRLYVAEKTGRVVAVDLGHAAIRPVLDISSEVSQGGEQGLLGMAFSPDGRFLYVDFTDLRGDTHVSEYAMHGAAAAPLSARQVLVVRQPYSNHNGGQLVFGPDGHLYVGLGDGGGAGDPEDNAQSLSTLLGKILRIDPRPSRGRPYGIPDDNPFVGVPGAWPEIWDYGLRNPWRFSFDARTGDLWIGDVGQDAWEEVDHERSGSAGGLNFGWNHREGNSSYGGASRPAGATDPVYEYSHAGGACSITGGYVYRGTGVAWLRGAYVFADFCVGRLMALRPDRALRAQALGPGVPNLSSFGEDAAGRLYVMSLDGGLYRIRKPGG